MVSGKFPDYLTMIVEVEEDSVWKVAALSIWDASYVNRRIFKAKGETYNPPTRTVLPPTSSNPQETNFIKREKRWKQLV